MASDGIILTDELCKIFLKNNKKQNREGNLEMNYHELAVIVQTGNLT